MSMKELIELEAGIEAEIALKVPEGVETIRLMLAEEPTLSVGEVAAALLLALPESHLAWYVAFLFMEKAKNAAETIKEA